MTDYARALIRAKGFGMVCNHRKEGEFFIIETFLDSVIHTEYFTLAGKHISGKSSERFLIFDHVAMAKWDPSDNEYWE